MKKIAKQMSESIELGIVLAASGGFMDAYSYIMRDHVFANAQTGNMLLLGVSISERTGQRLCGICFRYLHLQRELCLLIWCVFGWMREKGFTGGRFLYC